MTNQPLEITVVLLELHHVTATLLQITVVSYYKLRQFYYKLQQNIITNQGSFITNYGNVLLQITAAFGVITNYGNTLLQITAGITIYDVITNYILTPHSAFILIH